MENLSELELKKLIKETESRISKIYDEFPGLDYVVIRWNPDKSKKITISTQKRFQPLLAIINFARTFIIPNKIIIIYMFYDKDNDVVTKNFQKIFINSIEDFIRLKKINELMIKKIICDFEISEEIKEITFDKDLKKIFIPYNVYSGKV